MNLKEWKDLAKATFGENTPQVKFFEDKIKEQGENEEVIANEQQVLWALCNMK